MTALTAHEGRKLGKVISGTEMGRPSHSSAPEPSVLWQGTYSPAFVSTSVENVTSLSQGVELGSKGCFCSNSVFHCCVRIVIGKHKIEFTSKTPFQCCICGLKFLEQRTG